MKTSNLIFIGIKGSVVAVDRTTGEQVWATHLKGVDLVNVTVQEGMVLAMCQGEIFCLDPLSGAGIWHNRLKGLGVGLATIAVGQKSVGALPILAEKRRRDEEAAAAAAVT